MKSFLAPSESCKIATRNSRFELITDREPSFSCGVTPKYSANAWIIGEAPGDATDVALLLHGWRATPHALSHLGRQLASQRPGLATVVMEQPKIPLPTAPRHTSAYFRELRPASLGELRMRTALAVGKEVCRQYGTDRLEIITHSLGTIDGTRAAVESDSFEVSAITPLAGAGLIEPKEVAGVLWRSAKRLRGVPENFNMQCVPEAVYALSQKIRDNLEQLHAAGTKVFGVDFAKDHMFPPRESRRGAFHDGHVLITEGCACHSAPTHLSEVPRIATVIERLHCGTYIPMPRETQPQLSSPLSNYVEQIAGQTGHVFA